MLEHMSQTLASGGRIEIQGFGSFSLHYRRPEPPLLSRESMYPTSSLAKSCGIVWMGSFAKTKAGPAELDTGSQRYFVNPHHL